MEAQTFKVGKFVVEFTPQDLEHRVALGEIWEKVTVTPAHPTGKFHNLLVNGFDWQIRRSAWNACVRGMFSPPKRSGLHLLDSQHPDRLSGHLGWIRADLLSDGQTTMIDGMTITNPFTRQAGTGIRQYGSVWPFARLIRLNNHLVQARQDNTQDKKTGLPWGSLLHEYLDDLSEGATFILYPLLTRGWKDGEEFTDNKNQKGAQWLYATLVDIEGGKLTLDTAKQQYYTNKLFFKISQEGLAKDVADGTITEEDLKNGRQDAADANDGKDITPRGLFVNLGGEEIAVNLVPANNYKSVIAGKEVEFETRSFSGHMHLEGAVKRYGTIALVVA